MHHNFPFRLLFSHSTRKFSWPKHFPFLRSRVICRFALSPLSYSPGIIQSLVFLQTRVGSHLSASDTLWIGCWGNPHLRILCPQPLLPILPVPPTYPSTLLHVPSPSSIHRHFFLYQSLFISSTNKHDSSFVIFRVGGSRSLCWGNICIPMICVWMRGLLMIARYCYLTLYMSA